MYLDNKKNSVIKKFVKIINIKKNFESEFKLQKKFDLRNRMLKKIKGNKPIECTNANKPWSINRGEVKIPLPNKRVL